MLDARNRFAAWAGVELELPCFLYGPERSLPDVRRGAFTSLAPDAGPSTPHPTAGSTAVGARPVLVAYNVWIASNGDAGTDAGRAHALSVARSLAAELRGPSVRSLGLPVGEGAQVSFNLIDPGSVSVAGVYDAVAAGAESSGCSVLRAELVGLVPAGALEQVPRHRWPELDLDEDRTIEGLIEARRRRPVGGDGGRRPGADSGSAPDGPALHGPLTAQPPALTLGKSPPDPELLPVGQGVLQAILANDAPPAHFLGLAGRCPTLGEEKIGVHSHAVGPGLPAALLGPVHQ